MPTFLDLAQKVGSESGTVQHGRLTTVADPSDRVRKVVRWTRDAYRQIQNAHRAWLWLQDDFEVNVPPGQQRNSAADLGLARWAEWDCRYDSEEHRFSLYEADNQAGEYGLSFQDWRSFYASRLRGVQPTGRPAIFTISPKGEIVLWPSPAKACVLRGPYRQSPQELTDDDDVPEMPAHHHDLIVDVALVLLTTHDEAAATLSLYQMRELRGFSQLERDQLPRIAMGGTFA